VHIKVDRSQFARELAIAARMIDPRSTLPILSHVMLETDTITDSVRITTTDLELGLVTRVDAQILGAGTAAIPAKRLLGFIQSLSGDTVEIKIGQNFYATVTAGRSRARIPGSDAASFPTLPEPGDALAELPCALVSRMIRSTIYAISAEESRFTLNGGLLVLEPRAARMVATDGHRLALFEIDGLKHSETVRTLVPRKAMAEVARLAGDAPVGTDVAFSVDDNHHLFGIQGRLLIARKLTGNFPDYQRVMPKSFAHERTLAKPAVEGALRRAMPFADERSRAVRLTFTNGTGMIHAVATENGEIEDSFDAPGTGEMEVGLNGAYVQEFLGACPTDQVVMRFNGPQQAVQFEPWASDGDGKQDGKQDARCLCVVMPMRI
jgi:DNA polymerase-3 subunit beta